MLTALTDTTIDHAEHSVALDGATAQWTAAFTADADASKLLMSGGNTTLNALTGSRAH